MSLQNPTVPPRQEASNLEKAAKVVGIIVALVGCLIAILGYLRGCESKPTEDHDAKLTQQLVGTWFQDQIVTSNGEDLYILERFDNSGTGETTTTEYIWRYLDSDFQGRFLCVSSIPGKWSVHGNTWSIQRTQTTAERQMYASDGGPIDPRWIESGYRCGTGIFAALVELKIDSVSSSTVKVVSLQADQNGKYVEATYTRTRPFPGFLRRKWYWLTHLFD